MRIDHVGIAVRDIAESAKFYRDAFGLVIRHEEEVPGQGVRVAFLGDPADPGRAAAVELLEPTGGDGAVARFLAAKGPGMHHLAFHAGGVGTEMRRLAKAGIAPIDAEPRPGARGHSVCFLHPKSCGGVLVELVGESR